MKSSSALLIVLRNLSYNITAAIIDIAVFSAFFFFFFFLKRLGSKDLPWNLVWRLPVFLLVLTSLNERLDAERLDLCIGTTDFVLQFLQHDYYCGGAKRF